MDNKVPPSKCVDILVFNEKGDLLLQKRAAHDDSFPGYWDFSAGGHVENGEDIKIAAEREVFEELGVKGQVIYTGQENFEYPDWNKDKNKSVDAAMFRTIHNGPFKPDPNEVEKVEFFSLEKIGEMINSGINFHPEFLIAWKRGLIKEN